MSRPPPVLGVYGSSPVFSSRDHVLTETSPQMISSLAWGEPVNSTPYLMVSDWDRTLSLYDVNCEHDADGLAKKVVTTPVVQLHAQLPMLCCTMNGDGTVFYGGCDMAAHMVPMGSEEHVQVAQHSQPVKSIAWVDPVKILVTGGWDERVRFWDLRQQNPVYEIECPGPVQDMDFSTAPICSILCPRKILMFDFETRECSPIDPYHAVRHQLRCIANFREDDGSVGGFIAGSIDGRVIVNWLNPGPYKTFSFRGHREATDAFPVNAVAVHPAQTIITAGSNGVICTWDKEEREQLVEYQPRYAPVSHMSLNSGGTLLAYALSYDWSRGREHHHASRPSAIAIKMLDKKSVVKVAPKNN